MRRKWLYQRQRNIKVVTKIQKENLFSGIELGVGSNNWEKESKRKREGKIQQGLPFESFKEAYEEILRLKT